MFRFIFLKPVFCVSQDSFTGSKCFNSKNKLNIKTLIPFPIKTKLSQARMLIKILVLITA